MKAIAKMTIVAIAAGFALHALAAEPAKGKAAAKPAAAPAPVAAEPQAAEIITFNRLLKPKVPLNRPPMEDGIHDPTNTGTAMLQPPADVLMNLPRHPNGNGVNWVAALNSGKIRPRNERDDPTALPTVMDLNILRPARGAMPDVVFPHKQHTEWLDCSNCHPAIFVPQKGANQISMAAIMLGQKCGVCHGKVAFPVTASECRRCHSAPKTAAVTKP